VRHAVVSFSSALRMGSAHRRRRAGYVVHMVSGGMYGNQITTKIKPRESLPTKLAVVIDESRHQLGTALLSRRV